MFRETGSFVDFCLEHFFGDGGIIHLLFLNLDRFGGCAKDFLRNGLNWFNWLLNTDLSIGHLWEYWRVFAFIFLPHFTQATKGSETKVGSRAFGSGATSTSGTAISVKGSSATIGIALAFPFAFALTFTGSTTSSTTTSSIAPSPRR